jgi:hypothetical protein
LLARGGKKIELVRRLQEYDALQTPRYVSFTCTNINAYLGDPSDVDASGSFSHGSRGTSHSQSAFEHAVTHDVEELCSSFDRGLSGELDEDDNNERDDPMVGDVDDPPILNGIATLHGAVADGGTADAKTWVSVIRGFNLHMDGMMTLY